MKINLSIIFFDNTVLLNKIYDNLLLKENVVITVIGLSITLIFYKKVIDYSKTSEKIFKFIKNFRLLKLNIGKISFRFFVLKTIYQNN